MVSLLTFPTNLPPMPMVPGRDAWCPPIPPPQRLHHARGCVRYCWRITRPVSTTPHTRTRTLTHSRRAIQPLACPPTHPQRNSSEHSPTHAHPPTHEFTCERVSISESMFYVYVGMSRSARLCRWLCTYVPVYAPTWHPRKAARLTGT